MSSKEDNKKAEILAIISNFEHATMLIRIAYNKSKKTKLPWKILHITSPDQAMLNSIQQERNIELAKLVTKLGGQIIQKTAYKTHDIITEILDKSYCKYIFALAANELHLFSRLLTSVNDQIKNKIKGKNIKFTEVKTSSFKYYSPFIRLIKTDNITLSSAILSVISVIAILLLGSLIQIYLGDANFQLSISDISPVLTALSVALTSYLGLISGLLSILTSTIIIAHIYITDTSTHYLISFPEGTHILVFLISGLYICYLSATLKVDNIILNERKKNLRSLFKIHRDASNEVELEKIIKIFYEETTTLLGTNILIFLNNNKGKLDLFYPDNVYLANEDRNYAEKCGASKQIINSSNKFKSSHYFRRFIPLFCDKDISGVISIDINKKLLSSKSFNLLIDSIVDLLTDLLERYQLLELVNNHRFNLEQERLRSMLLSSVSHDFKTPLASIICSLKQYKRMSDKKTLTDENASFLIDTAIEESDRLDRFISNILDMTKLENDLIEFNFSWCQPNLIISQLIKSVSERFNRRITFEVKEENYFVWMDIVMIESAIQNLLENAAKYSQNDSEIEVRTKIIDDNYIIAVLDRGIGIDEDKIKDVFDKYERLKFKDSKIAGTGLGLAISKIIMQKHHGDIIAKRRTDMPSGLNNNIENMGMEFSLKFINIKKLD